MRMPKFFALLLPAIAIAATALAPGEHSLFASAWAQAAADAGPAAQASTPRKARQPLEREALDTLLDRRLTPAMKRQVNERLRPGNRNPQARSGRYGSYVDLRDRASSVMIAVIDDNGDTVLTDVMRPLPVAEK